MNIVAYCFPAQKKNNYISFYLMTTTMKKTYINPQMLVVQLTHRTSILEGSMTLSGTSGHATFYGDATGEGDALTKQNNFSVWSDDWSTE